MVCVIVMDVSVTGLRLLREIAERGSFTAAGAALGYTQSAVSRQIAALERATHARLLDRRAAGVRLTDAGRVVLRHATVVLDALDAVDRDLSATAAPHGRVRLGAFASAGAGLLPQALGALRRSHPGIEVTTREAASPALARALRAGTLDLAVLALSPPFRAPDAESPRLLLETLSELSLLIAVPDGHPLAGTVPVRLADLRGQRWVTSSDELSLGIWPGLDERPPIGHVARDWLTKLHLVAAGCGLTTLPALLLPLVPAGVRVVAVADGPRETRRLVLARPPGPADPAVEHVSRALRAAHSQILCD
jgi:DNA-binding transcriptional LysR family regulator